MVKELTLFHCFCTYSDFKIHIIRFLLKSLHCLFLILLTAKQKITLKILTAEKFDTCHKDLYTSAILSRDQLVYKFTISHVTTAPKWIMKFV